MSTLAPRANLLGALTAESDVQMLNDAFYESSNYRALVDATDFRFVVGRRGTGKSALFQRVSNDLKARDNRIILIAERPSEELVTSFNYEISKLTQEYLETRKISRLTWKVHIISLAIDAILAHYKASKVDARAKLNDYRIRHSSIFAKDGVGRSLAALREALHFNESGQAATLPEILAERFDLSNIERHVVDALADLKIKMIFLYDGLDEGWVANKVATGFLGGLAKIASEFRENQGIHCLLFIRDNMFRALAEFDGDYSRNIEGSTLRLHWDETSLLEVVALRLRAVFGWKGEQNIRAWDRFAKRELSGIDGFRRCLHLTLYRPRDMIALLNGAFQIAQMHERTEIIGADVDVTATKISQTRLQDLFKEYEHVFPGLPLFVDAFREGAIHLKYQGVLDLLDAAVSSGSSGIGARDFAILRTGSEAFSALYSVGFVGIQNADQRVRFCHDGSNTDVHALSIETVVVVHPCYWKALELRESDAAEVMLRVDDEDDQATAKVVKTEFSQMRVRKLGTVIAELGTIREGQEDARKFEKWVYDAIRYLFVRRLDSIVWRSPSLQTSQRDIVGALNDVSGFWRRLSKKYEVNQLIIEPKNYAQVTEQDFKQAWARMSPPHGSCLLMITRAEQDGLSEQERAMVKEGYALHKKLVITIPVFLLHRALRKMQRRDEERDDYVDKKLLKRMEQFEHEYVGQRKGNI